MRKSRSCAPHAGAIVVRFELQILFVIADQANSILNAGSFFSHQQVTHQRKEQP